MQLFEIAINQCEINQELKYDRNPIKTKRKFSETSTKI